MGKPFVGFFVVKDIAGVKRLWLLCLSDGADIVSSTKLLSDKRLFQVNMNMLKLEVSMLYNGVPMVCTKMSVDEASSGAFDIWFLPEPGLPTENPQAFTDKYINSPAKGTPEYTINARKAAILIRDEVSQYYTGKNTVDLVIPSAFFAPVAVDRLNEMVKVMKAKNLATSTSTSKFQSIPSAELMIDLPSVADIDAAYAQGDAAVIELMPNFKDIFKPFKTALESTPFWRMMPGMPERVRIASLRALASEVGMYIGMVREGELLDHNYVDVVESDVMGSGEVDEVAFYDNEEKLHAAMRDLIYEDFRKYYPQYSEQDLDSLYATGALTTRMKEFLETLIVMALHYNWGQNGLLDYSVEVARYGEVKIVFEEEDDAGDDVGNDALEAIFYPGNGGVDAGGNTLVRINGVIPSNFEPSLFTAPINCDSNILKYMNNTCYANKLHGYNCAGCDGYIELFIKLLRWGDRRRYRIKIGNNPVFDLSLGKVLIEYKSLSSREAELIGGYKYSLDALVTVDTAPHTVIGLALSQRLKGLGHSILLSMSIPDVIEFYSTQPSDVTDKFIRGLSFVNGKFSVTGVGTLKRRTVSSVLQISAKQEGKLLIPSDKASELAQKLGIAVQYDLRAIAALDGLKQINSRIKQFDFSSAEALYDNSGVTGTGLEMLVQCAICRNFSQMKDKLYALSPVELGTDAVVTQLLNQDLDAIKSCGITSLYDMSNFSNKPEKAEQKVTVVAETEALSDMNMFSKSNKEKEEESIEMKVLQSCIYQGELPKDLPYIVVRNNFFKQQNATEPFLVCGYLCVIDKTTMLFVSKDELPQGATLDNTQRDRPFASLVAESLIPISTAVWNENADFKSRYVFASSESLIKAYKIGR